MSDFLLRKMETSFVRFDTDHDGMLSIKDFMLIADKLIESGNVDAKKGTQLKAVMTASCEKFLTSGDKPIIKEAFLRNVKSAFGNPELKKTAFEAYTGLFSAIDTDGDDVIYEKDLMSFFKIIGMDSNMAKVAFQALDADQDGMVNKEEYVAAAVEYVTGTDESSPAKYFWGPLVEEH